MTSHISSTPILDLVTQACNSQLSNSMFEQLNWLKLKLRVKKKVRMGEVNWEYTGDVGIGGETYLV